MKTKAKIVILVVLSLLSGVGLAGGLYLVSTPTNVSPRAASSIPPTTTSQSTINNQQLTISPTPTPAGPVTREEIIASFGQNSPRADLNADGAVNSLDLSLFDQKSR